MWNGARIGGERVRFFVFFRLDQRRSPLSLSLFLIGSCCTEGEEKSLAVYLPTSPCVYRSRQIDRQTTIFCLSFHSKEKSKVSRFPWFLSSLVFESDVPFSAEERIRETDGEEPERPGRLSRLCLQHAEGEEEARRKRLFSGAQQREGAKERRGLLLVYASRVSFFFSASSRFSSSFLQFFNGGEGRKPKRAAKNHTLNPKRLLSFFSSSSFARPAFSLVERKRERCLFSARNRSGRLGPGLASSWLVWKFVEDFECLETPEIDFCLWRLDWRSYLSRTEKAEESGRTPLGWEGICFVVAVRRGQLLFKEREKKCKRKKKKVEKKRKRRSGSPPPPFPFPLSSSSSIILRLL